MSFVNTHCANKFCKTTTMTALFPMVSYFLLDKIMFSWWKSFAYFNFEIIKQDAIKPEISKKVLMYILDTQCKSNNFNW